MASSSKSKSQPSGTMNDPVTSKKGLLHIAGTFRSRGKKLSPAQGGSELTTSPSSPSIMISHNPGSPSSTPDDSPSSPRSEPPSSPTPDAPAAPITESLNALNVIDLTSKRKSVSDKTLSKSVAHLPSLHLPFHHLPPTNTKDETQISQLIRKIQDLEKKVEAKQLELFKEAQRRLETERQFQYVPS